MADTVQTIQNFYTQAQQKDFARKNLFRVLNINFGSGVNISFNEDELVYATTAKLPGKKIANKALPYMGLSFNIPGTVSYPSSDSYAITFRCDESYKLHQKFLDVVEGTFSDQNSTGNYYTPREDAVIDLVQLDKQLDRIAQYQLVGVSIKDVGEVEYDVTDDGTEVTFNVTISYHYFRKTV